MNLCRTLIFIISLSFTSLLLAQDYPQKVALEVLFDTGRSITADRVDLSQRIFKELRPDIRYQAVVVSTGLFSKKKKNIRKEVKLQIERAIRDNEEIEILIIDTPGTTRRDRDSGGRKTWLKYIGEVYENRIGTNFQELFDPITDRTSDSLQIILSGSSTLQGSYESAEKRSYQLIKYFNAPNGSVYGSSTPEVSPVFDSAKFFRFRYLLPNLRGLIKNSLLLTAILSPATLGAYELSGVLDMIIDASETHTQLAIRSIGAVVIPSGILGGSLSGIIAGLRPLMSFVGSKTLFNRGWIYHFNNYKLENYERFKKHKDFIPLIKNHSPAPLCSQIL